MYDKIKTLIGFMTLKSAKDTHMNISGKARLAGVIGYPISHTKSPKLHNFWLNQYNIDGAYIPLSVSPEHFVSVLRALAYAGFCGVNITLPHKEAAFAIMDQTTSEAKRVGAVNTVVFDQGGRMFGSNTDGFGFVQNLHSKYPLWDVSEGPAVIFGSGGASRAICATLLDLGISEIRLVNRSQDRAQKMAEDLGGSIHVISWKDRSSVLADVALLVNATTLGMAGGPPLDVDISLLPNAALVTDIVYEPLQTSLLKEAEARGHRVVDGIGMLLHQARPGFALWFGVVPDVTPALRDWILSAE